MSLRILLVEDSAAMCAYLSSELTRNSDRSIVGMMQSEEQATRWLDAHPGGWDVAIVDLYLREGSGVGVLRHCQERGSRQVVLVATNHAIAALVNQCKLLGADEVFDKSRIEDLVAYCQNLPSEQTAAEPGAARTARAATSKVALPA